MPCFNNKHFKLAAIWKLVQQINVDLFPRVPAGTCGFWKNWKPWPVTGGDPWETGTGTRRSQNPQVFPQIYLRVPVCNQDWWRSLLKSVGVLEGGYKVNTQHSGKEKGTYHCQTFQDLLHILHPHISPQQLLRGTLYQGDTMCWWLELNPSTSNTSDAPTNPQLTKLQWSLPKYLEQCHQYLLPTPEPLECISSKITVCSPSTRRSQMLWGSQLKRELDSVLLDLEMCWLEWSTIMVLDPDCSHTVTLKNLTSWGT